MFLPLLVLLACRSDDSDDTDVAWIDTGPLQADDFSSVIAGGLFEAEPHVAASPSGQHVAVAWIAYVNNGSSSRIGTALSHDGGEHWTAPGYLPNDQPWSSDPVVAVADDGRAFVSWLAFDRSMSGEGANMHLYVSSTPPGGDAFDTVDALGVQPDLDKPWIAIDGEDRVVVSYAVETDLWAAGSEDGGATFEPARVVAQRLMMGLCADRARPEVYGTFVDSDGNVESSVTTDGGATWADPVPLPDAVSPLGPFFPSCAARGDDVWAVWGTGTPSDVTAIRLARGPAWSAGVEASDPAAGTFVHLAQVAAGPTRVELAWLQATAAGQPASLVHAWTTDGTTFQREVVDADVGPFSYDRSTLPWYGDYQGLAAEADTVWFAYPKAHADQGFATHIELERRRPE